MRPIGFSTGALALGDFRRALAMIRRNPVPCVELSALRQPELRPLMEALPDLDLSSFSYVSVHAPSGIEPGTEPEVLSLLEAAAERRIPIVLHPDAVRDLRAWATFRDLLLIENMDRRKPTARTAEELQKIFQILPEAGLCFDIGHARQVDPTMAEAACIAKTFGNRIRQLHVSEVSSRSTHERLTFGSLLVFSRVAHRLPEDLPVILETPVQEAEMHSEIDVAQQALLPKLQVAVS